MHFNAITCFSQRSLVCAWARARRYETYPEIEAGLIFLSFFSLYRLVLGGSKSRGLRLSRRWNNKASGCSCLWPPLPTDLISDLHDFVVAIDRFTRTDNVR